MNSRTPDDPTDGFPHIVQCDCGARTGFTEPTDWHFECRDCGKLNVGSFSIDARSEGDE